MEDPVQRKVSAGVGLSADGQVARRSEHDRSDHDRERNNSGRQSEAVRVEPRIKGCHLPGTDKIKLFLL